MARNIWVTVFDIHYPHIHYPTWYAALDFIRQNPDKIAGFLFGGDQHDNAEISHHTAGKPLYRPTGSYAAHTKGFDKILTELENVLPDEAERVWIQGNHDAWVNQLIERQPELSGTLERPLLLNLEERGWQVLELGEGKQLGKLLVIHGEGLTGIGNQASIYHAKKSVESFCCSVLYGHLHTAQSYTKILPHSEKDKWIGYSSPACCTLNPTYLQNRPTAWVNGFTIVELQEPSKKLSNFNVYPVIVSNGSFAFGGNVYGKKA
jgi:predicted phosphodiesterase